jgi:hypothetical protein
MELSASDADGGYRTLVRTCTTGQFRTLALASQLAGKQPLPSGDRHPVIPGHRQLL